MTYEDRFVNIMQSCPEQ